MYSKDKYEKGGLQVRIKQSKMHGQLQNGNSDCFEIFAPLKIPIVHYFCIFADYHKMYVVDDPGHIAILPKAVRKQGFKIFL